MSKKNPKLNQPQREIRTVTMREVRVSMAEDGTHTVSGYAIVYNASSTDLGGFTETIVPGALTRTLLENPDVLCLRDHKPELLLGRTTSGTLSLSEDQIGLKFTCTLPKTSAATDLAESLSRGDIDACSFGFVTQNDTWTQDANGDVIRNLLDIDLFEVSIVSFPAYMQTSASLRSAPIEIRSLIESRDNVTDVCGCQCAECLDGDCDDCTDLDCDEEFCSCLNRSKRTRKRLELRLRLLEMIPSL
jgi:HK97 family phage prohead protease